MAFNLFLSKDREPQSAGPPHTSNIGRLPSRNSVGSISSTGDATVDMKSPPQEMLTALVERITYHNAENVFCVLRA
jgi:hypothetical protein